MPRLRLLLLVPLAACPEKRAMWLDPNSDAQDVVVFFGETRGVKRPRALRSLFVDACNSSNSGDSRPLWSLRAIGDSIPKLEHVVLGVVPRGYRGEPTNLASLPNCIVVSSEGEFMTLLASKDGRVREVENR